MKELTIHHNPSTLTTGRKPAATNSSARKITPPNCKNLLISILFISALFALSGCEKQDVMPFADPSTTVITKTVVTPDALLGDWHVLSAVVTLTSGDTATAFGGMNITADMAWDGMMMEFTEDSVRFHRRDIVYSDSPSIDTADTTLSTFPASYLPDGSIIIDTVPLAVLPTEVGTLILRGKEVEIEIKSVP